MHGLGGRCPGSYTTSKPAVSNAPKKDRPFVTSGVITPKSTASNRATVKIILWMKYDDRLGRHGHLLDEALGPASKSTRYAVTITIPMKGDHGVQAVQYRKGKQVSRSATRYFYVQP